MKKKIILLFLIYIIILIPITGCSNVSQLAEKIIINGVGIDKDNETYNLTIQQFLVNNNDQKEEDTKIIKANGNSVKEAFSNLSLQTGKEPMYSQNLILVIGKDTAINGINDIIDFFIRYYESRPTLKIVVSDSKAEDIINFKKNDKIVKAEEISEIGKSEKINSKIISTQLYQFVGNLLDIENSPIAPVISISNVNDYKSIVMSGTAVFKNDKLKGFINNEETRGTLLIKGIIKGGTEVIDIKNIGKVSFGLGKSSSKINCYLENEIPVFDINIKVNANIDQIDRDIKVKPLEEDYDILKLELENRIKEIVLLAINKLIFKYNSDIFNFSSILKKQNTKYYKLIEKDLENIISKSKYNINVESKINKTGQEISISKNNNA